VREVDGTETAASQRRGDLVFPECLAPEEQQRNDSANAIS
jgi:hypothetical protein